MLQHNLLSSAMTPALYVILPANVRTAIVRLAKNHHSKTTCDTADILDESVASFLSIHALGITSWPLALQVPSS